MKIIALLLFILLAIWLYRGNTKITVTNLEVVNTKVPASFQDFTMVHISDLHNAPFGKNQKRLVDSVREASPDIILITGDLIDSNRTNIPVAMEFIEKAVKIAPVYYVTGNHEAWTEEYPALEEQLLEAGVQILDNTTVSLTKNGESMVLAGIQDPAFVTSVDYEAGAVVHSTLEKILQKGSYTILLSHRPEYFDIYVDHNVDLVLSGHAHGGQVRIPFIGGLVAPGQGFFPTYSEGMIVKNNTTMIVSRGLGNSIIPLRINNTPEVIVITLKKSHS